MDNNTGLLTVKDLAEITKESLAVWRKRIFCREIPFLKLGSNVRVRREDLDDWFKSRLQEPTREGR